MVLEVPKDGSLDAVRKAFKDKNKLVYVVVAEAKSETWAIALDAEQSFSGLVPVRIEDPKQAGEWITEKSKVAATSDWNGNVLMLLTGPEAENKDFVFQALLQASESA